MAMQKAHEVLRTRFNFPSFRSGQREAIEKLLCPQESQPARVVAVFPTGAGKSLVYQIPSLCFDDGITLVVSPLLALMRDQTTALVAKGIPAASLDSTLDAQETRDLFDAVAAGEVRLLYVAPERFKNERFIRLLKKTTVALFVVDEAHCISEWGHSFRPDYLRLARFADELGFERRLALTATATPEVVVDISRALSIPFPNGLVRTPAGRHNLATRVTLVPSSYDGTRKSIAEMMTKRVDIIVDRLKSRPPGPTIVYVTLQAMATTVAEELRKHGFLNCQAYHAGVKAEERKQIQDWFMGTTGHEMAIVVATIAFGMGIDKSNIRYVYHLNLPKSLEAYVQEIGRAGRDGEPSICEVLACVDDLPTLEAFALGSTPSREAIMGLVRLLMDGKQAGDVTDLSVYDATIEFDIRDTVMGQLLAQLDLSGGFLQEITPFYSEIRCKKVDEGKYNEIIRRGNRASKILNLGHGSRTIRTLDVREISAKLNIEYGVISREMDDLVRDGLLAKAEPYKLRSQFRVMNVPHSLEEPVDRLFKAAKRMEEQEIKRLNQVVDFLSSSTCQSKILCERFGDDVSLDGDCGHCAVCYAGGKQAVHIDEAQRLRAGRVLDNVRWAVIAAQDALPRDDPVLIARFAAGISSPRITKLYKKLPGYGTMSDHAFGTLLEAASKNFRAA
jgi:ATP-dependent DNA helicase RecQ